MQQQVVAQSPLSYHARKIGQPLVLLLVVLLLLLLIIWHSNSF
jgi:uncharacterized membrane protein